MNFAEQLRILQAAQGDPAKLALATVDLKYPELAEAERATLKESLEAAAIPHWCDEAILAALLDISPEESAARLAQLRGLTVVERFLARGETAVNVHEAARLALRKRMAGVDTLAPSGGEGWGEGARSTGNWQDHEAQTPGGSEPAQEGSAAVSTGPAAADAELLRLGLRPQPRSVPGSDAAAASRRDRFRDLSARAARCFERDAAPARQIEWIYHRLCAEPDRAADELENLDRHWTGLAHPEDHQALAVSLQELEDCKLVAGAARVEVLLCVTETRNSRGETSQLEAPAREGLALAKALKRPSAEAHANCLLGDVLEAQGKLAEAQAAFGEYLRISRQLAEQDPGNAGWQLVLAVAHNKMGLVLSAQKRLDEAKAEQKEYRAILKRLAASDPSNAVWRRELGVATCCVADLETRTDSASAALPFYEEAARIFGELAEKAPGFAQWAKDKERVDLELSLCRWKVQASKSSR
jgi:tetratricopeptide (TPR) repeat protein